MIVRALEHQKTHRAVHCGEQQHGIGHGNVIGNQKRSAACGNAFAPGDIKPVKRVREHPQQQPQQRVRQQP
jgi:hypothetical protein